GGIDKMTIFHATGLPAKNHHVSTADLALLARAIIKDFPEHYGMYSEKYFTYNKIRQPNRNKLLWRDNSVDGLKTGHTDAAGYCLVASATRNGMRLISVVMGTRSEEARAQESQKLLSYGFRYFETLELYPAGEVLNQAKVWSGVKDQIRLGTIEPVAINIPRGQSKALSVTLDLDKTITAPVAQGARYGSLIISLQGEILLESPVVALEAVEPAGLIKRIWHSIMLFVLNLIGS
ncbi:MAG: D-alanyl-D-alanine carboxypeptidase family protein, partial [Motiliproteus sp.]